MITINKPDVISKKYDWSPRYTLRDLPKGVIIHAMASKYNKESLKKHSKHYNKTYNTILGVPYHTLDEVIDASTFLYYMGLSAHRFGHMNGIMELGQEDTLTAWHAGKSSWDGLTNLNGYYLSYELLIDLDRYEYPESEGYNDDYSKFLYVMRTYDWLQAPQFDALVWQLVEWCNKFDIKLSNIVGHDKVSPGRKSDPGVMFPWKLLYKYLEDRL
jgi:N-acetyl-anhydromuramyl-L-alanine amidase AmpD